MRNRWRLHRHAEPRGRSIDGVGKSAAPELGQRQHRGFVQRLAADLHLMSDALRIREGDQARTNIRHRSIIGEEKENKGSGAYFAGKNLCTRSPAKTSPVYTIPLESTAIMCRPKNCPPFSPMLPIL